MARENSVKTKAKNFIKENPGLSRKEYIAAFVEMGVKESSASMYHFWLVTQGGREKVSRPRDSKGRFIKKEIV